MKSKEFDYIFKLIFNLWYYIITNNEIMFTNLNN